MYCCSDQTPSMRTKVQLSVFVAWSCSEEQSWRVGIATLHGLNLNKAGSRYANMLQVVPAIYVCKLFLKGYWLIFWFCFVIEVRCYCRGRWSIAFVWAINCRASDLEWCVLDMRNVVGIGTKNVIRIFALRGCDVLKRYYKFIFSFLLLLHILKDRMMECENVWTFSYSIIQLRSVQVGPILIGNLRGFRDWYAICRFGSRFAVADDFQIYPNLFSYFASTSVKAQLVAEI